jgi:hypothetical protein
MTLAQRSAKGQGLLWQEAAGQDKAAVHDRTEKKVLVRR